MRRTAGRWSWARGIAAGILMSGATALAGSDEFLDRLDEKLTWMSPSGYWRARLSGLADLEGYALPRPAPGVIDTEDATLVNPRLTVYLDMQLGPRLYAFTQARADRGFDPGDEPLRGRLDEYALRWTPVDSRFSVQVGRFATVVGSWTTRHDSWTNPFITAPLPYEQLTGVWDNEPPHSVGQLLVWSHVRPGIKGSVADEEKYLRLPIAWGPSYATGVAVAGELDRFRYAFEVKNASLSSRPQVWGPEVARWDYPTVSGRVRYSPDPRWEMGLSASTGTFMRPESTPLLLRGHGRGDYRQTVLAHDLSYAWHHLQLWAEVYAARFEIPQIADADTLAYYVEAKYKFTPAFFGAVRWNQQFYGRVAEAGHRVRWGHDMWRFDVAPAYRFTSHTQLKLQYSMQWGEPGERLTHMGALQATLRF